MFLYMAVVPAENRLNGISVNLRKYIGVRVQESGINEQ